MGELPPDAEDNRESADRSYGAYEMRFLRQVKERYVSAVVDLEFVDRLIGNSVNLVGRIYGKIYFPTFPNSLKEVGPIPWL